MLKSTALLSLCAATGLAALTAGCASAPGASDSAANGARSAIESLAVSNPAVYSSPNFRSLPPPSTESGLSGSSVPPGASQPIFTGTETFPPGANGPEAPGSLATGSTVGQAGGG